MEALAIILSHLTIISLLELIQKEREKGAYQTQSITRFVTQDSPLSKKKKNQRHYKKRSI